MIANYNFLLDKDKHQLLSNKMGKQVKSCLERINAPSLVNENIAGEDSFSIKLLIHQCLLRIKTSQNSAFKEDATTNILSDLNKIELQSQRTLIMAAILDQVSIQSMFNPLEPEHKAVTVMVLKLLQRIDMANSSIKQRYAEQFVIGCLKPYLQNVNSKPNGSLMSRSHDLVKVLEEAYLLLGNGLSLALAICC